MAKVSELKQKRMQLLTEARGILDSAEKESRSLSGEDTSKYENITAELDALDATIRVEEDVQSRQKAIAEATEKPEERKENSSYDKVFNKYLRRGVEELDSSERAVLRSGFNMEDRADMLESVPAQGGYTVPVDFSKQLIEKLEEESGVRQAGANVLNTGSGNPILIPAITAHTAAQGVIAEGVGPTAISDTFDQVALGAFKYPAITKVSVELLQDSQFNVESLVTTNLGRAVGRIAGAAWAVGAGAGAEPQGIITGGTTTTTAASTTQLKSDDVIDLIYSVTPPYRRRGAFLMHDQVVAHLRKIKWNIGSDPVGYAWQPSLQVGAPDTLFGYPVYTDPNLEDTVSGDNLVMAFGDFNQGFTVRMAGGVNVARLNERFADVMMVGFLTYIRTDSVVTDPNAYRVLKMHS